ncbi:MAG: hypothetical protein ISN28_04335 [Ectothiorhodospiraceae bacterium AqS1]|nr:hypothetical protein [Ectothiorhodospiraceae bacterium AqS1]
MIELNGLVLLMKIVLVIVTLVGSGAVFAYWLDRYMEKLVERKINRIYAKRASESNLTGSGNDKGSKG